MTLCQSGHYTEAASCLPDCVTACPRPFLLRLLLGAIPLLEDGATFHFEVPDIRIMLSELTNLTLSPFFPEFKEFSKVSESEVEEVRLALCKSWNALSLLPLK
jgi:hypothetical protein